MNDHLEKFCHRLAHLKAHVAVPTLSIIVAIISGYSQAETASQDFGQPPSGRISILFNDRHVYDPPTTLVRARVLGAIAVQGNVLVPARSLLESMGATFTYDAKTGAIHAFKRGADIRLTVRKREVVINGEARSLDVPPRVERGTTYVPLRVLSEGLGAYVSWVPAQQLVSIRYNAPITAVIPAATNPSAPPIVASATPAPPAASAPSPTPSPPARSSYVRFLAVDLNLKPAVSNEFDAGKNGNTTQRIRGAFEYRLGSHGGKNFAEVEYRRWSYPHVANATGLANGTLCSAVGGPVPNVGDPGCVTTIGGRTSAFVNSMQLSESELEFRNGLIALGGHTYVATATRMQSNSYGYPRLKAKFGVGLERLPDLSRPFTVYASIYYFPELGGTYSTINGIDVRLRYKLLSYEGGLALTIPRTPLFLEVGAMSERYIGKENAPSNVARKALTLGFGVHF